MPGSEFAHISASSNMVGLSPPHRLSKTTITKSKPAMTDVEYDYNSDDEIAATKAEQLKHTPSPKASILSKVKAKLQSEKQPKPTSAASSSSTSMKKQARADTIFAYKVLAETRM